jgi:Flp pilus assembly protein TadD/class 3 adenylate cyclase
MSSYFAVVFTDLVRHSLVWGRVPRHAMTTIIAEYRYLAQSIASQYGRRHENFTGDGHLFLFESADVAAHFGLKLIAYWKQRRRSLIAVHNAQDLPIRVGCHFGECSQLTDADVWIGRAINVAKRVEASAEPDSFFVTQTILELIDLPFYDFNEAGLHELKGDFLPQRQLYRLSSVDHAALAERPMEKMSAEDWFLKGVGMVDLDCESFEEELECYRQAVRLRANYPEAHNNLAILLKTAGDENAAARHYEEALRVWPNYPEAHYNFAILLETIKDLTGAAAHYQQAIRCRPDYTDARLRYAGLLASGGDWVAAERQYQEVLRLRPGYAEAHNNYGIFLEKRGDVAAAQRHYIEALQQRPDYPEAHYNYAMLLEKTDEAKAEEHYRAAIRVSPGYVEAHNNLAILLHERGDLAGAEEHYSTALRLRPSDPETNYNFALLAQAKGDKEAANRHFSLSEELARGIGKS